MLAHKFLHAQDISSVIKKKTWTIMCVCIVSMHFSSRMIPSNEKNYTKIKQTKTENNQTINEISKKKIFCVGG